MSAKPPSINPMIETANPSLPPSGIRPRNRFKPHLQVWLLGGLLLGMGGGTLAGLFAGDSPATALLMHWFVKPVEQAFLFALFLLIVPLLISAIVSGIARIRNMAGMRQLLVSTLAHMLAASVAAALIGLAMANLFRPGDVVPAEIGQQLLAASHAPASPGMIDTLFSYAAVERPIKIVIIASVLAGMVLTFLRTRRTGHVLATSERVFDAGMHVLAHVARLAPVAVACFMFDLTLVFGWHLLLYLSAYVAVVVAALLLQIALTFFAVVWMRGEVTPLAFLRGVQEPAVIAFCTSSSNATLPSALRAAELDLRLPPRVARLVLGTGTIANQGGTAIYTAVTVLFIAQFFGMDLSLGRQGLVLAVAALAGMGTIGVPAGSLPTVAAVLALTGLPAEGIGLVIGVDRLLDMFRTMVNVVGDIAIATAVSHDRRKRSLPKM
ncbi:dicarboxylate/amino acid:cation symporter [Novosphingobium aerophilum]|uniref:dicarboxylate/amino acid:cation symporter n=1 Tax=Novosphingobium aerophilum TaxID=2839843 RepID=UPI003FD4549D